MSDLIVIQPQVTELTVTEDVNQVVVSSVGVQGAKGDTGATGATGDQGPSGVIAVTAPITNSGTSTSANIGVSAGSTSTAGVLQLTDSVTSTSTTTAATPNAVATTYKSIPSLPKRSGNYFRTPIQRADIYTTTNQLATATPIFIETTMTLDRIAAASSNSFSGTSTVRLGIYSDNNGAPGTLLLDAGTVNFTGIGQVQQITISQSVTTGFYWLVFCQQGTAPTTGSYWGTLADRSILGWFNNQATTVNANAIVGYSTTSVTGALPSTWPTPLSYAVFSQYVWVRMA